jgi:hypothetical protein
MQMTSETLATYAKDVRAPDKHRAATESIYANAKARATNACGIELRALPPRSDAIADPRFAAEIRELTIAYEPAKDEIDSATVKAREVQHKGLRRVASDDFSVTWTPVKGRQGTDIKALSAAATAAGIDIHQFETTAAPADRIDVRVREARLATRGETMSITHKGGFDVVSRG